MVLEKSKSLVEVKTNGQGNGQSSKSDRLDVMKTYKLYIDGKFPRSESGRYYVLENSSGKTIANICRSSRKDFRESVVAARKAQPGWSSKSAYNKGQIIYRIAEMLEGRRDQFINELKEQGSSNAQAEKETGNSIDRLLYYAGWCDKYQQVFSSVNPVESSHFNFSVPEPMGVVAVLSYESSGLLGLITSIIPAIAGGNTVVSLASSSIPLSAVTFGEVLNSSDVPAGVVNILTGHRSELLSHFATHMDINALVYCGDDAGEIRKAKEAASLNVKRVSIYGENDLMEGKSQNVYRIMDLQEIKTTCIQSDSDILFPLEDTISRNQRITVMKQQPFVVWLTGLSGSGKSTIATTLEKSLTDKGFKAYLLDGDAIRSGLNKDLDFSEADRHENIRRIGEICKLMSDAGLIVITSFISPFRIDRNFVRALLPPTDFAEVYVNASLEICESRDVKGLYQKARQGLIKEFTGISSPYEHPLNPELILNTDRESEDESLNKVLEYLLPKISLAL